MPYADREKQLKAQSISSKRRGKANRILINSHKAGKACIDCGAVVGDKWPACSFDFDHRDPNSKEFHLANIAKSQKRIVAEITKCDLRCANCHRAKTVRLGQHYEPS